MTIHDSNHVQGRWRPALAFVASLAAVTLALAQGGGDAADDDEIYELSPFVIDASGDTGYQSLTTLSVTRTNLALKDLPQSIDVINRELIDDLGLSDYQDIVNFSGAGGPTEGNEGLERAFTFRGLNSRFSKRNTFIWYNPIDQYVIDRVEVVRGPASLLYGEGEPSGTVNTSTKQAQFYRNFTEISYRIGEYDERRAVLDLNRILIDDKLSVRIAALDNSNESWRPNEERDHEGYYINTHIRPVDWAVLRLEYQNDSRVDYHPSSILRLEGVALSESTLGLFPEVTLENSQSWAGGDQARFREFENYTLFLDMNPTDWFSLSLGYNEQDQTTLQEDYNGSSDLIAPGGKSFGQTNPFDEYAVALRPDGGWSTNLVETFVASAVFDFDTEVLKNKVILGYQDEKDNFQLEKRQEKDENNKRPVTWIPLSFGTDFTARPDSDPSIRVAKGFSIDQSGDLGGRETTSYYIAYQGKAFRDRLRLFAGARNDDFFKTGQVGFAGLDSVFRKQGEDAFDVDSYNYGFLVGLDRDNSFDFYYNHAESFRPAGSFRTDPLGNGLDPSIGEGDEFGLKFSLFGEKLTGIATYYDIEFGGSDFRVTTDEDIWDPDDVAAGNFTNAPTASTGWELQFVGNLIENLSVIFSYGESDPKTGGQITIPIVRDDGNGNPVDTGEVHVVQEGGDPLLDVDERILNLATRYTFDEGAMDGFTFGGNLRYRMDRRAGFNSAGELRYFGDYLDVGLFVRYEREISEKVQWSSIVNLNNAFEETYRLGTLGGARWGDLRRLRWTNTFTF